MTDNAYFRTSDPALLDVVGYKLNPEWWSRPYEYAWALGHARGLGQVADMGCGWMDRPLRHGLALYCEMVYAVDADPRVMQLPNPTPQHLRHIVGDFARGPIASIGEGELDAVFCVSVLEDLSGVKLETALDTFVYHLRPGGRIYLTFDVLTGKKIMYPGLDFSAFETACRRAGVWYAGEVDYKLPPDDLRHDGWNLACFHALLEVKE